MNAAQAGPAGFWRRRRASAAAFVDFLGYPIVLSALLGIFLGFVAYFVEIAFAYSIQAVLKGLGAGHQLPFKGSRFFPAVDVRLGIVLLVILSLARSLIQWGGQLSSVALNATFLFRIRTRLLEWMFRRQTLSGSDLVHLFTDAAGTGARALTAARLSARHGMLALLLGASLFYISPILAALGSLTLVVFALVQRGVNRRLVPLAESMRGESRRALDVVGSSVRNLLLIRLHHLEDRERDRAQASVRSVFVNSRRARLFALFGPVFSQLSATLLAVGLILVATHRLNVPAGTLVVFLYFFFRFTQALGGMNAAHSRYVLARPALAQLFRWWKKSREADAEAPALPVAHPLRGKASVAGPVGWRFERATFGYDGAPPLFDGFDFTVEPGSVLAVSGPSGAGKSTFLNLLLGEAAPRSGSVRARIDGQEAEVSAVRGLLLDHIAFSGPDPFLVHGTLYENVAFGLPRAPDPGFLREMMERAQCGFVDALPDGLQHRVTDQGTGLSAGQKQRLSLLRALLRKPKALILDEATSHLDSATEARILEGVLELRGSTTLILVSHRAQVIRAGEARLDLPPRA